MRVRDIVLVPGALMLWGALELLELFGRLEWRYWLWKMKREGRS